MTDDPFAAHEALDRADLGVRRARSLVAHPTIDARPALALADLAAEAADALAPLYQAVEEAGA